jgi:hypothetical protein
MRNEWPIQCTGLALEPLEPVLAEAGCRLLPTLGDVLWAKFEPAGDPTGTCVGHRGDGCGGAETGAQASSLGPQSAFAVQQMLRSQAPGVSGAVDPIPGAACEPWAPADPVVRTAAAPRGAVVCGLPPAHVQADLGDEGGRGEDLDAVDAGHVDAAEAVPWGGQSKCRLVASGWHGPTPGGGRGVVRALDLAVQGVEVGLHLEVALGDLLLVPCVAFQGLAPLEEPRCAPVPRQAFGEGVRAGVDAGVFSGGPLHRVAFAV